MTVKEMAKLVEVSPVTVSLVLNGKNGVGDAARHRIMDIVRKAGYIHKTKISEPS